MDVQAIGVNFIDVTHRCGNLGGALPRIPGVEASGIVRAVGPEVSEVKVGDLVAYGNNSGPGSYAQQVVVPSSRLIKLPQGLDARTAAAATFQGMTAHFLCRSAYRVKRGDRVLVHAGAGGVGLLLTQMVKNMGGYVFSTVSTAAKAEVARQYGADQVIVHTQQDLAEEIKRGTRGQGVQVVYECVGKATFDQSLSSLGPRGYMVLFGLLSGPIPPVDPAVLMAGGSRFFTRPSIAHYTTTRPELVRRAGDVYRWIKSGEIKLRTEHVFPLHEAAEAHRQLESRATTGKVLLVP